MPKVPKLPKMPNPPKSEADKNCGVASLQLYYRRLVISACKAETE